MSPSPQPRAIVRAFLVALVVALPGRALADDGATADAEDTDDPQHKDAGAPDTDDSSEDGDAPPPEGYFHAGEVVVASRRIANIEQAGTVTVIEREEIEAHGDRTLADTLERLPGVQVYTHNKGQTRLRLRGFDLDRVMILIDGVPINDVYSTEADLSAIPLANVAKIVINRGVASALYGSDGSVGSINVITRKPEAPFGEAYTEWGPYNNATVELVHGAPAGDFYYLVTGMFGHSDGFVPSARLDAQTRREWFDRIIRYDLYPIDGPFAATGPYNTFDDVATPAKEQYIGDDGVWDHQRFSRYQLTLKGGYRFAPELEAGLASELYYYSGRTNTYEPVAYNSYRGDLWKPEWPYFGDDELEVKKFALRNRAFVWPAVYRVEVGPYLRLRIGDLAIQLNAYYLRKRAEQLGYASTDHRYLKGESALFKPVSVYEPFRDIKTFDSYGFRLIPSYRFARWHRLSLGLHYRYDTYVGAERALNAEAAPTIYESMGLRVYAVERLAAHTFSLGLEDELRVLDSLKIAAGVSYDSQIFSRFVHRDGGVMVEAYRPADDSMLFGTRDALNPVAGLVWDPVERRLRLRAAGAIKTRFPTLGEYAKIETADLDQGLEPERIYHLNAGFELFFFDEAIDLRSDWFATIVDHRIVKLAKEEPPVNADRVVAQGVETTLAIDLGHLGALTEMRAVLGHTFTHARNRDYSDDATVNKGRIVEYTPVHQLLADLRLGFASGTALDIWLTSYIEQYVYAMDHRPTLLDSPYSTDYFATVRLHDPVLLNARVSQQIGDGYEAALSLENILDDYRADPFNPGPGRTFYVSLRAYWD